MSKQQINMHSSGTSFCSNKDSSESISHQLDRLNQVIQSLAYEHTSPDVSRFLYSPSIESLQGFSKVSGDENEEEVYSESIYKNIEDFLLELDRASMIREDFRSMEIRRMQKSVAEEIVESSIEIDLMQEELIDFIKILEKLRDDNRKSISDLSINLGNHNINFTIRKNNLMDIHKDYLANSFFETFSLSKLEFPYTSYPQNSQDDPIEKLVKSMQNAYNEQFSPCHIKSLNQDFISIQDYKKQIAGCFMKQEQQKIIENLEWQSLEMMSLKDQYHQKLNKLIASEAELFNIKNSLKNEEYRIYTQKMLLAKDVENLFQQKRILEKLRDDNKKRLEAIKTLISEFTFVPEENKNINSQKKTEIECEMNRLQNEIDQLEQGLDVKTDKTESLQMRIDRLKTQQSYLKTLRVMNASAERSTIFASRVKGAESRRAFALQELSRNNSTNTINSQRTSRNSIAPQPQRSLLPQISINKENQTTSLEGYQIYIKTQESRLIEREQELNKRETMLTKSFGDCSSKENLIQTIQNEQRNLKILRKDLEKRQKILENDILTNANKTSELSIKEKEFSKVVSIVTGFIKEQNIIENRLQMLFEFLDCVAVDFSRARKIILI
ncbi:hypothetical protein SteCoe_17337 [Stentor coeruleus]|uniref:Uncharacterized protein n=1 Tax=Stentor coeruleus TaxID=5963 RepID=A0A1R2BZH7_9CILI|nr:hypothetical protein SteCoe_17337 [Stentor coeruleus]